MIGAVVGVQPFGGEGLSGTGPKAGGPHYLVRMAAQAQAAAVQPLSLDAGVEPVLIEAALGRARASGWSAWALDARCAWLERVGATALAATARRQLAAQALPGPTGERNELRLHPRGVLASVASTADAASQGQWQAALAAGNTLLVALPPAARDQAEGVLAYWRQAGLPDHAVQLLDAPFAAAVSALVADARVAGLLAEAGFAAALRPRLAARDGAIVPLWSGELAASLWPLCAEQTLTVNTAAAGGNAALLAGLG
jgi:RHH-type proline utilization regulon transcriptional repressor/proline dehydrogenase/delta 1-pyrroline-5-carboxylate dehydrogenase